ncbi:MAG TPA: hypothetical protein VF366_03640 [Dehalococcoidia bacterium]
MNNRIKVALRIAVPLFLIMTLGLNGALPVLADNASRPVPAFRMVQGEVLNIVSDNSTSDNATATITLKHGNKQLEIQVDAGTKYYLIARGKPSSAESSVVAQPKGAIKKNYKLERQTSVAAVADEPLSEAAIVASCARDPNSLGRYGKPAQFSDVEVGDRIIACVKTADNVAKQVLIIKAPIKQKINGTITEVSDGSITIAPVIGNAVTLNWDANTKFTLKGLISVQSGQYASAIYNRNGMLALTVDIQASAPTTAVEGN